MQIGSLHLINSLSLNNDQNKPKTFTMEGKTQFFLKRRKTHTHKHT
jgi:hypothetical protein